MSSLLKIAGAAVVLSAYVHLPAVPPSILSASAGAPMPPPPGFSERGVRRLYRDVGAAAARAARPGC